MEHDDATTRSRDVGNVDGSLPDKWCVLDEWSDHSESELEEGEIVDTDSDCDTRDYRKNTVTYGQVPSRDGVNQAPQTAVEAFCRKTPTNLLKMAEAAPFSGSEDGEIVELENPVIRKPTSDKIMNVSSVRPAGSYVTDTVASSEVHVANRSQSSEGKCNGENSFPLNRTDSAFEKNGLNLVDTADEVQPVEVAAQDTVPADSVKTSETLDVQTGMLVPNEIPELAEIEATKDPPVPNGSAAMSASATVEELRSHCAGPDKLPLTHPSGLDGEFDIDMTDMIAAEDRLAGHEAVDNGGVAVGNKDLDDGAMIEDDEEMAAESTECVPQPTTSKDNVVLDDGEVPVTSNAASMDVVSPASNVTSDSCRESCGNGVKSDIPDDETEMETTATHVENSDNMAEELLLPDGEATSTQNEVLTNHVDNTTRQEENTDQCNTLDAEMMGNDTTGTTDDTEIPANDTSVNVENSDLSEINKDLISAIEDLANVDKELDTRDREEPQEESSDKDPGVQTDEVSDVSKDAVVVVEIPAVTTPSPDVPASTVTATGPSASEVDVTSSAVVQVSPDVAEVSVSPAMDTQELTTPHRDTCIGLTDAAEDIDVITIGTQIGHTDPPGKHGSTDEDSGTAADVDLHSRQTDTTGVSPQIPAPVYVSILKDTPRKTKAPPKTLSASSGSAPELLRTLHPCVDTARIGVRSGMSRLSCDFCPMVCDDESEMILHLDRHEKVCCATRVASTFEYSHHMYQCVACAFSTRSRMVFREHIRSHIVKFPYSCGVCNVVAESIAALRRHSVLIHPDMTCRLVPRHCGTLEQILHKLGPEAPSTVTRLQNTDGTPVTATVLTHGKELSAPVARPPLENKEQHSDAEQVIVLDDIDDDDEMEKQNDNADSHSPFHLKISSVVSLSDSAKAVENFSSTDDSSHSSGKDSSVVPMRPSKSAVLLQCQFIDGLYQCKRCKYKTPDRRTFRYHIVHEVHERSKICHDCHAVPMAQLLSESHYCPMVEKVMRAIRRPVQSSADSEASAINLTHPDMRDTGVQPGQGVADEGYILHIPDRSGNAESSASRGNAGASGLRHTMPAGGSPAHVSLVRTTPVTSATQLYVLEDSERVSDAGEDPKAPNPVSAIASSSVHSEAPASNPSDVVVVPTPTVISPIVIQPINSVGMPATLRYPTPTSGGSDGATYSTVSDGEMPHLLSPPMQDSSANNLAGCTGSWSTESNIPSFSGGPPRFTPTDHRGGLDSSFTEAFSMLDELGNAQAGLCTLPQPQLTAPSPRAQELTTDAGRPTEVIIVPESPTEETPAGVAVPQVIGVQPQRADVIADTRSSPRLINQHPQQGTHLHRAVAERSAEGERKEEEHFAYYRCGFSACNFLGDSETGFCNHYYDCHRDVYLYRCAFCTSMFRYPPQLCEHLRHCHQQVRYRCLSCREPFVSQRQLIVHMIQTHRLNTCIRCASPSICSVSTISLSQFRAHYELSHSGESHFICSCCSMEFSAMAPLMRHIERSINRFVSCPVCKRMSTVAAYKKLLHHIITEHPDAPRTIVKMNFINCWEKLSLGGGGGGGSGGTVTSGTAMQIFTPDILKGSANASGVVAGNGNGKGAPGSRDTSVVPHARIVVSAAPPVKAMKSKQTARKTSVPHSVLRNELMRTAEEPEVMLICDRCNFACSIPVLLDQHRRLHDRMVAVPAGTLFKCSRCPFFTNSVNEFKTHSRYHLTPQNVLRYFRCTACSRYATNDMELIEEHMERRHSESSCSYKVSREVLTHPNTTIACQHCGVACLGDTSLERHMQQSHSDLVVPAAEKPTRRSSTMLGRPPRETSTVSIEKYHCDLCEFDTNSAALMKQHHATEHTSKTPEPSAAVVIKQEPVSKEPVVVESLPSPETATETAPAVVMVDSGGSQGSQETQGLLGSQGSQGSRSFTLLTCEHCPYNTHVMHHMDRHKKSHEEQLQITEGFRCGYCRYVSTQKSTMTRHVRRYHATEPMNLKLVSGGVVSALPLTMDLTADEPSGSGSELKNAVVVGTVKQVPQPLPTLISQTSRDHTGSDSSVLSISDSEDGQPPLNLSCDKCAYKASSRNSYARHQRNHSNTFDGGFRCAHCGYTSMTKGPVTKHISQQHPGLPVRITHLLGSAKKPTLKVVIPKKHVQGSAALSSANNDDGVVVCGEMNAAVATEPASIAAFELSLPKEMIFKVAVDCPMCDYSTKVHHNMVRHLQGHCDALNTANAGLIKSTGPVGQVKDTGHGTSDGVSGEGLRRSMSSEVILTEADEESDKPSEADKQTDTTTSYGDSSSEEDDDSDYMVEEGGGAVSKGVPDATQYCTRVQHMDLYRCTKCVFMHRFPSKVRRHYFYKHAKCYPYQCGHCSFEAVESGKIKRHCILMHDLLPIKVIKRQVDSSNDASTLSEGVVMSDVRRENVDVIDEDEDDITDDSDTWLGAYITKMNNDNRQQCRICGYVQLGASSVKRHVLAVHLKFYPYSCRYCSYAQVELNKVKKHIEHSHPGRPCCVVKRKLGGPPWDGDDVVSTLEGGDVISVEGGDVVGEGVSDVMTEDVSEGHPRSSSPVVEGHQVVSVQDVSEGHPRSSSPVVEGRQVVSVQDVSEGNPRSSSPVVEGRQVVSVQDVSEGRPRSSSPVVEGHLVEDKVPGGDGDTDAQGDGGEDITSHQLADGSTDKVTPQPASDTVEEDLISSSQQPSECATDPGLGDQLTEGDYEGSAEISESVMMDVDRQSPDKHTGKPGDENEESLLDKADELPEHASTPTVGVIASVEVPEVTQGRDDAREHDTVSVGGQQGSVDLSTDVTQDKGQQISDAALRDTVTAATDVGVVQAESSDGSDTKGDTETVDNDGDTHVRSVDVPAHTRIEGGSELSSEGGTSGTKNVTDTVDTLSESQEQGDGSGDDICSGGEHQEVDFNIKDLNAEQTMLPEVTSSVAVVTLLGDTRESQSSAEKVTESLGDGDQQKGSETTEENTTEDKDESISVEQSSCVAAEQIGDGDMLSDGDEDNDDGGVDAEESEDFEVVSEDAMLEETGNVSSRANSPTLHRGNTPVGQFDHIPVNLGTVTEATAGSSLLPEMTHIKRETPDTSDGYRHREEPILSMFANELAETAIKQEHSQTTDLTDASLNISMDSAGSHPMIYRPTLHQSLSKQRKVFLCVYCDYRSMYSPSDVRKHIFAVHMRRYPYRCAYCDFQNMKKFNVQKHTKKTHAGRPVIVTEAPVFRNNLTILESQGNKVSVGVVGADGIPVLDVNLLGPLLLQLDDSPTKDIPGKKWTRKPPEFAPQDTSSVPSSETEKEATESTAAPQWRCTECGLEAERIGRIQVHVLTRHLKLRPYQCPYCPWGTWKTTPVEEHVRLKHPAETVKVLENVQRKLAEIKKYIVAIPESVAPLVTEVSPVQIGSELTTMHCDLCPYTASSQTRMQKHRKTHFSYRPFGCFHCEYTSFSRFKVRCHSSRVHKDKQVIVKTLKTPDMLDPRNKTPQTSPYKCVGGGVQVCGHCPYMASTSEKLDSHMKREHPELMSYKCGHCGIYLTSQEHMAEHVIESHAMSSRSTQDTSAEPPAKQPKTNAGPSVPRLTVKYEQANKNTATKRLFNENKDSTPAVPLKKLKLKDLLSTPRCAGAEPKGASSPLSQGYLFRCRHCNFTSSLSLVMRHHVMAHLHYRPFYCPACDNVRAVKSYPIKKHIAVYHQGGSVQCALERDAEMECKVQGSYVRETLSGTPLARCEKVGAIPPEDKDGLFVYKCNTCEYASPTHKFMQHHVMAHLNYRPYRCPYCATMHSVRSHPIKKHIQCMHRGKKFEIAYTPDAALDAKVTESYRKQRLNDGDTSLTPATYKKIQTLPVSPNCQKKVPTVSLVAVPQHNASSQGPEKKWQTVSKTQDSSDQPDVINIGGGYDKRPKGNVHTTYVCKWCGYTAGTPSLVRLHAMIHFGYRPFSCPHCTTMKSVRSYPIKKHIRSMHPGKPIEVILNTDPNIEAKVQQSYVAKDIVSKASASATSKDDGKKVSVEQRRSEKVPAVLKTGGAVGKQLKKNGRFVCNMCSYASPNWTLIRRHVMVHVGYRPYHCPYCPAMKSVRGSPVRIHIRAMHSGKPVNVLFRPDAAADAKVIDGFSRLVKNVPRKPSESSSTFADNTVTATPGVAVSPKRIYPVIFRCVNCSFKTKYKADLRFHLMGEMGYRPFTCSYCDHKSVGRCLLRKHHRRHHVGKFTVLTHHEPQSEARLADLMQRSIKNGIPATLTPQPISIAERPIVIKQEPDIDVNDADGLAPMARLDGATATIDGPRPKRYKRYNCTECSYSCSKKKLLLKHCLVRHDPKKYGCGYCDFREFYPSHVRRHCRRHHRGLVPRCILLSSGEAVSFRAYSDRTMTAATVPKAPSSPVVAVTPAPAVRPKTESPSSDKAVVTDGIAPDNVTQLFNRALGKYECYLCLYSNSNVTLFKKHISVHYPARWQCGHCSLKFRQMDRLRRHSRLAHPGIPIRCANDEPGYDASPSESPATVKPDPSPQAQPLSVPRVKVTARKSIHKIIPCATDDVKPPTVPKMKVTARKSINPYIPSLNETVLRFYCGLCPFAATNEDALSKHMLVVHSSGSAGAVQLKCGFCSFTTFDDAAFIEHARSHALGSVKKSPVPQIDPNGRDMQPDVELVDLLHLSQSELENLLVKNDIGGIYF